ncbi:hypothetical protein Lser_V15G44089 [Lactuca serriola]
MNKEIFNNTEENNSEEKQILTYVEDEDGFHANLLIKQDLLSRVKKIDLKIKKENIFKNVPSKLSILNPLKRKNEIFYFVSTKEMSVDIKDTIGAVFLPLLTKEQIHNNLKSIPVEIRSKIRMVHIGAVKILIKSQFQAGINSPIKMALINNRITDRQDCILGAAKGNLAYQKFMFSVYPKFALDLKYANIDKTLSFIHHFERSDLMSPGKTVKIKTLDDNTEKIEYVFSTSGKAGIQIIVNHCNNLNQIIARSFMVKNNLDKNDFEKIFEVIERQNKLTIKLTQSIDKHSILLENSLKNNQFVEEVAKKANIEGTLKETNLKITNIHDQLKQLIG